MDDKLRNYYLEAQIKNASPGQLLIMLYDGLIQNAECAEEKIASPEMRQDPMPAAQAISRCINILTELCTSLKYDVDPKLCSTLGDLYHFFTREFSEAFDKHEPAKIRAILPLIRDLRKAWYEADRQANRFQPVAA